MKTKQGRPPISKKGARIRASISFDPDLLKYLDSKTKNRSAWINAILYASRAGMVLVFANKKTRA